MDLKASSTAQPNLYAHYYNAFPSSPYLNKNTKNAHQIDKDSCYSYNSNSTIAAKLKCAYKPYFILVL